MEEDARTLSLVILNQFESSQNQLGKIQNDFFSKKKYLIKTKARAKILTNEIIRLKGRIDYLIEQISGKKNKNFNKNLLSILRIGFYEILYDHNIPDYAAVSSAVDLTKSKLNRKASGLTNAVLRKLIRKKESSQEWEENYKKDPRWNSFPLWIQSRWLKQSSSEKYLKLITAFNKAPKTFVRNDSGKTNTQLKEILDLDEIESEIFNPFFLKIKKGTRKILNHDLFQSGKISIQDPSSYGIVQCLGLKKNDIVLDVCAAPGTKSLAMSFLVGESGKVFSSDSDTSRVELGVKDLKRNKLNNIFWLTKDATKDRYPLVDNILIDAPCSGTGVMRRKADIKWRRKELDIDFFSKLQFKIISHMSQFLKPGGILVYGTCSIEYLENWYVVEQFLKLNNNFSLISLPTNINTTWIDQRGCLDTITDIHEVDGMFAARIKKND